MNTAREAAYQPGDIAVVEGRVAVYMPTRWEWMDGSWTAFPYNVGPVLGNVYAIAEQALPAAQPLVERACEVMHDAYEAAAVGAGWETQERSRKPWVDVPEANKATMRAAVGALLDWLRASPGERGDR